MSEPQTGARRYPRTFGGLVGSMIVLVAAVVGYWVFQNLTHDQPEGKPVSADYRNIVKTVQGAGITVAYPRTLPDGWLVQDDGHLFTPGDRPVWKLPVLTDDGRFIGVHQQNAPLDEMLATDLRGTPRRGEDVALPSGLTGEESKTWSSWTGDDGDHAFATKVGSDTLVVYGSAPVEDLKTLVGLLTTDPA